MGQNSRERFVELEEKRVIRAIKDIRLIGNLSNKSNYSYSETDYKAIFYALDSEIRDLKSRFTSGEKGAEPVFRLPRESDRNG